MYRYAETLRKSLSHPCPVGRSVGLQRVVRWTLVTTRMMLALGSMCCELCKGTTLQCSGGLVPAGPQGIPIKSLAAQIANEPVVSSSVAQEQIAVSAEGLRRKFGPIRYRPAEVRLFWGWFRSRHSRRSRSSRRGLSSRGASKVLTADV